MKCCNQRLKTTYTYPIEYDDGSQVIVRYKKCLVCGKTYKTREAMVPFKKSIKED